MKKKFILGLMFVAGLTASSCSNNDSKKNPAPAEQTPVNSAETATPSDGKTSMEAKLKDDSLNVPLRTAVAANYYSTGDLEKAAYHFTIINQIDPKNFDAIKNLADIYYDSHQDEKAILFYEKAIAMDPNNINMKCDLATCYSRINKTQKAIDILRTNIKADHNHAQSHYNLSVILDQTGKKAEAAEELKIYHSLTGNKK